MSQSEPAERRRWKRWRVAAGLVPVLVLVQVVRFTMEDLRGYGPPPSFPSVPEPPYSSGHVLQRYLTAATGKSQIAPVPADLTLGRWHQLHGPDYLLEQGTVLFNLDDQFDRWPAWLAPVLKDGQVVGAVQVFASRGEGPSAQALWPETGQKLEGFLPGDRVVLYRGHLWALAGSNVTPLTQEAAIAHPWVDSLSDFRGSYWQPLLTYQVAAAAELYRWFEADTWRLRVAMVALAAAVALRRLRRNRQAA